MECNDTVNSEELINATEYLTLNTGHSTKRRRCNRVGILSLMSYSNITSMAVTESIS